MSRSPVFDELKRILRIARFASNRNLTTSEAIEQYDQGLQTQNQSRSEGLSRRQFLGQASTAAAGAALIRPDRLLGAPSFKSDAQVGIVGAGIAGLSCGYELLRYGVNANVYDATQRGGRMRSFGAAFGDNQPFPGQNVELGGEFIDTLHSTMKGYVQEFGLTLEDVNKEPGERAYFFDNVHYTEEAVVEEFRALVDTMLADYRNVGTPLPGAITPAEEALDRMNLEEYLRSRGAGNLIYKVLESAYIGEYGKELSEQNPLNLLLLIHLDRRSFFREFGIYSDERFHVVEGNEKIPQNMRAALGSQFQPNHLLVRMAKTAAGRYELTFIQDKGKTATFTHDIVVLALPFSTLRQVELHPSLGLPDWKLKAIQELQYGYNAKIHVGFDGRPWLNQGYNALTYTQLPHVQVTWETNPILATPQRSVICDYSGGNRGLNLNPKNVQAETEAWLADFNRIYPGSKDYARRLQGKRFHAIMSHWPSNPYQLGAYTCNHPGYFGSIANFEQPPIEGIYFAGEHASSFYEWQGWMEGGALTGLTAASEILHGIRSNP